MPGYMPKSKSDKYMTPPELYERLNAEFNFDYDPCPIGWKIGDPDGLTTDWPGNRIFVNPPYSKVSKWIEKCYNEWQKGKTVVLLINAITDTIAFHKYILNIAEIRFIQGRLKFIDYYDQSKRSPNVKPSMICVFSN